MEKQKELLACLGRSGGAVLTESWEWGCCRFFRRRRCFPSSPFACALCSLYYRPVNYKMIASGAKKGTNMSDKRKRQAASAGRLPGRFWPLRLLAFLLLLAVFLFAPFTAGTRAFAITSAYDFYCERKSLPHELGLDIEMPIANMDFFPLMITYNDDNGMSTWLGRPVRFTVDYAVADFGFLSGHSRFYDFESPLYNAYVGAYYLHGLASRSISRPPCRSPLSISVVWPCPRSALIPDVPCFKSPEIKKTAQSFGCQVMIFSDMTPPLARTGRSIKGKASRQGIFCSAIRPRQQNNTRCGKWPVAFTSPIWRNRICQSGSTFWRRMMTSCLKSTDKSLRERA